MLEFEFSPTVIDAHRETLRKLYAPLPAELRAPTGRQRLGAFIVRLGERIGDIRDEVATEAPVITPPIRARA